ncbi:MAG: hypothetical protein CV087_16270 [Candidatus Brocadia sp. WS118]|nr:MAG: hypothetical protein CV087_16270 [Candidatus Brocadia sp. WS118]
MNQSNLAITASKDLKLGALLTFIGVNLRFVVGNIIHGLIYFNFLQSGNHEHRYEVHVPNLPDMCGDVAIMMVFASAYFFITAGSVKKLVNGISDNFSGKNDQDMQSMKESISWEKNLFFISIIGFGLYFFSKYFLSIEMETFFEENEGSGISVILHIANYLVRLCSVFAFVTVYCRYLSLKRTSALLLYVFFFTRFLFASNMLEFINTYDLYTCASILDFLTPILIIYSVISLIMI